MSTMYRNVLTLKANTMATATHNTETEEMYLDFSARHKLSALNKYFSYLIF